MNLKGFQMLLVEQPLEVMGLVTLPQNVLIEVDIRKEVAPLVLEFAAILLTNAEVAQLKTELIFPVRKLLNEFAIY